MTKPTDDSYSVSVLTLETFVETHLPEGLNFIKYYAEGWYVKILMSGRKALRKFRPKIAVTTYHNCEDYRLISIFLTSLGYDCRGKGLLYFPFHGEYRTLMLHARARG